MGCASSKNSSETPSTPLKDDGTKYTFKVLLLGAGESGKSTVVKQLKVIHKVVLDEEEIQHYRVTIHNNTVTSMQVFVEAAEKFKVEWESSEQKELAKKIKDTAFEENKLMSPDLADAIAKLWKTSPIQQAFARRNEFWNLDAAPYYFDNVLRFIEDGYTPSEEDCIMARVRTTGIVTTEFDEGSVHFSVVDVAGQRSERKKWIHCFDDVKCLVFVVSLAGYNQVMFEDSGHNRMLEQLNLFQQIANNPVFQTMPVFLLLNKKDLFEAMIQDTGLNKCFPEYSGGADVKTALKFVQAEFEKRMEGDRKRLHVHYVAARYKKDIKYTWEDLKTVMVDVYKKERKERSSSLKSLH